MKAIAGGAKKSPNRLQKQRNGLLGLVHVAKKQLGLTEEEYRAVLGNYGASSSAALSISELEDLVRYFESIGFRRRHARKKAPGGAQAAALRRRLVAIAGGLENGEQRLEGLVKKVCGVDRLAWCRDVAKLRQVLAILSRLA